MDQKIRFCTSADGVKLAYAVNGEGPPLVMSATWLTHLEHQWRSLAWRPWLDASSWPTRSAMRSCRTRKDACSPGSFRIAASSSSTAKTTFEREIVGVGKLPRQELQAISQKSCSVLHSMGRKIQWVQSFVTDDKICCVYVAPDEEMVRQHAQKGGFPANTVARVRSVIEPITAE